MNAEQDGVAPKKRLRTASENSNSKKRAAAKRKLNLCPSLNKGMTILDKSAFDKNIAIPTVLIYEDQFHPAVIRHVKPYLLKTPGIKAIQEPNQQQSSDENNSSRKTRRIYLNPDLFEGKNLVDNVGQELKLDPKVLYTIRQDTIKFTYDNWSWNQILESVLPDDEDKLSSFSSIGHVLHLNLRDHLLPYKELIGQVLLDKISRAKTVVNKLNNIDNAFRNFQMEIIAGDSNTVVQLKENRCEYEFDFKGSKKQRQSHQTKMYSTKINFLCFSS